MGFAEPKLNWLILNEKSYDSKAIVEVAYGYARPDLSPLKPSKFTGTPPVRPKLEELGFTVEVDSGAARFPQRKPLQSKAADEQPFDPEDKEDARSRNEKTIVQRRGQRDFRNSSISAYGEKCTITGCPILDVVEAAHMVLYRGTHTNMTSNGLLLRADLHTLFDCNLLAIDPETMKVHWAPRIRNSEYKEWDGRRVRMPEKPQDEPSKEALRKNFEDCRNTWETG